MKIKFLTKPLLGLTLALAMFYIVVQPSYAQGPDHYVDTDATCSPCDGDLLRRLPAGTRNPCR